jgi:hypothetical protein
MRDMAHALLSFFGTRHRPQAIAYCGAIYSRMVINIQSVTDLLAVVQIHQIGVCALGLFVLFSLNNAMIAPIWLSQLDWINRGPRQPPHYTFIARFLPLIPGPSSGPGKISHQSPLYSGLQHRQTCCRR